ncbi:MAG: DUF4157 domain-containing protein [Mediterranea sp.]|jgi:hypothetical protein|nr:DUF4157 domain-containing protein [Mediterranea sp.]
MREYTKKPESQSRTLDSNPKVSRQAPIDVILQRYKERSIQRYATEEDELTQGKFTATQQNGIDEGGLLQGKFESAPTATGQEIMQYEQRPNNTGLPDNLKTGIENLSGYSMDDVKVHYNSSKPAQLQALAYAQATDIHVAPGQEQHLAHKAWHVVQQKQGRVQPTKQLQGININDNEKLERDADKYDESVNSTKKPNVIQRQVCLLKKDFTDDFVENTSIDYSYKRAGGPIETFPTSNFSSMEEGSKLYFVAHGQAGQAGQYSGKDIANRLTDTNVGLKNKIDEIVFTSCYAGTNKTLIDDSVVDIVYDAVKPISPDITVKGATGPSIKSDATGDDFMVIAPTKERQSCDSQKIDEEAFINEIKINPKVVTDKLPRVLTATTAPGPVLDITKIDTIIRSTTASKINELILEVLSILPTEFKTDIIFKSKFIAKLTELFYQRFEKTLKSNQLLKSTSDGMKIRKK